MICPTRIALACVLAAGGHVASAQEPGGEKEWVLHNGRCIEVSTNSAHVRDGIGHGAQADEACTEAQAARNVRPAPLSAHGGGERKAWVWHEGVCIEVSTTSAHVVGSEEHGGPDEACTEIESARGASSSARSTPEDAGLETQTSLFEAVAPIATEAAASRNRIVAYYFLGKDALENYPGVNCVESCPDIPLPIKDIPAEKLTHINLAFFGIGADYRVALVAGYDDNGLPVGYVDEAKATNVFELLNNVSIGEQGAALTPLDEGGPAPELDSPKHKNPALKTLLAIGGWEFSRTPLWQEMVRDPAKREIFAASAVETMLRYGFDGIDIDWEYPNYPEDRGSVATDGRDFAETLTLIREKLNAHGSSVGEHYLLTIASAGAPYALKGYLAHMDRIARALDFVNVMLYDFSGPWDTGRRASRRAQFHANLYADTFREPYWFNFLVGMRDAELERRIREEWDLAYLSEVVPHWRMPLDDNGTGFGGLFFGDFRRQNIDDAVKITIPETGEVRDIAALARRWDGIEGNESAGSELTAGAKQYLLFANGEASAGYEQQYWLNSSYMFDLYRIAGVEPEKLLLGVPFYGRVFRLDGPGTADAQFPVDPDNYPGLYYRTECDDPAARCTFYRDNPGYLPGCESTACTEDQRVVTYADVAAMQEDVRWTRWKHERTRAPGLYLRDWADFGGWSRELFITHDDPESLLEKVAFARRNGMGGVFLWELSQDNVAHDLVNALNEGMIAELAPHTIIVGAGEGGAIDPPEEVKLDPGSDATFTITAASGYEISGVTVDGEPVGARGTYTFYDVHADHTLVASFTPSDGGGSGGGNGGSCDGVPEWQAGVMYKQGDEVQYRGTMYRAWRLVKKNEAPPDQNDNWEVIACAQ